MDCILIVLIIYETQWDDVDEDGEGGGGYRCLWPFHENPQNIPHSFLKIISHYYWSKIF
jgi:hypothetical protein